MGQRGTEKDGKTKGGRKATAEELRWGTPLQCSFAYFSKKRSILLHVEWFPIPGASFLSLYISMNFVLICHMIVEIFQCSKSVLFDNIV